MTRGLFVLAGLVMGVWAVAAMAWPSDVKPVLGTEDVAIYKKLFADAERGKMPDRNLILRLKDNSLVVDAEALALSEGKQPYDLLKGWVNNNPNHVLAASLYSQAVRERPRPKQSCSNVTRTNSKGKKYTRRVCKSVGRAAALPNKPTAVLAREARAKAMEAAREREYAGLGQVAAAERRKLLGELWRLRQRTMLSQAGGMLQDPSAKRTLGTERWQEEMTKVAVALANIREWEKAKPFALAAASVAGPERDDARWVAGMAAYRTGDKRTAAREWSALVRAEPVNSKHYARAAWWAARAYEDLGDRNRAGEMVKLGAHDSLSFYGQLSAEKAGVKVARVWGSPRLDAQEVATLQKIPAVRRAMGLAQVGQQDMAQQVLKHADGDIPYTMTETLAAFALQAQMPGTALRAGNTLKEQGRLLWSALYPTPQHWQPKGGMTMDRALMLAVMRQESAFQPSVGSHAGARGLMQLMPATSRYIARLAGRPTPSRADLHNPAVNLQLAQDYIGYLNGKLDGNVIHVVAAYNAGPGNVGKWRSRGITPDDDPMLYIESIPLSETKDYVQKVLANWWIYQAQAGDERWSLAALAQDYWPVVGTNGRGERRRLAAR